MLKCLVQEHVVAEQKIREFKTLLFKSKRLHKTTKKTRLDSKKLIKKAVESMN